MRESNGMKRCPRCEQTMPVAEFNRSLGEVDGYQNWCRKCAKVYQDAKRKARIAARRAEMAAASKDGE